MPILKKGEIEAKATAYDTGVKSTGYVFYSYDKKASALFFQFRNQNGETTDIANAKIRLLLIKNDDEGKEFIPSQEDFEIISKLGGKAKFVLPEMLLAYQGKVTGYIYLDFEDGSQTDEGQFTFRIRRSMITHVLPEAGDKYVQDFEDVKERVEQAGDSATKDIEKAKDDAESQIGDYVGEVKSAKDSTIEDIDKALPEVVESAKQDISSSASDVQSIADKATSDIKSHVDAVENAKNSTVGDIEKAKDDAESQIGDYVDEVESAKQDISSSASDVQSKASEANEDIDDLVKSTEDARDEAVKTMSELDYSDRNLLVSDNLLSYSSYNETPVVEENGRKITTKYVTDQTNTVTLRDRNLDPCGKYTISGRIEINGKPITRETISRQVINTNHDRSKNERLEVFSDGSFVATETYDSEANYWIIKTSFVGIKPGDVITFYDLQFQPGSVATPWQPAMGDYDAKIKRLEKAIINLGGSI
ncbi:BppU family phage baseplate upper protein [Tetragenococcus halophilus]|uniref:BppU N-terminal domain-containing protein n=1 Tax=Tetragenococcus halophilus (strain DSM 20338 / JCM 20259 / NCIMB 9735 / NBRC 12172) TaxID=945021 RepID=A0AAN1SHI2_TETHN|nr:BppU family phage baseplate upper protein [Tetragenococcus halophilus]BAK95123.1 hypothetical protein TEH_17960 [Tetragenococcus halophilus NBRC 12172]GBD71133.1 putative uncharacterized protein [Tetragenococcus halophilus subsp. halophilus]